MKIAFSIAILVVYLLFSCSPNPEEIGEKSVQSLDGEWYDSEDSTNTWAFTTKEVKWRGYHHFYQLKSDSLLISGLLYRIKSKTEDTIQLLNSNAHQLTLVRIKSESSK